MRKSLAAVTCSIMLAAAHAIPAQAEAVDPATATCSELTKIASANSSANVASQQRMGVLLVWMAGFLAPESQGSVVDLVQLQADIDVIKANCDQAPTLGLKTVASKLWEKKQRTTPNSIDISTLTCSMLTQKQDDRAAAGLLWLIGNYASEEETPMFDMDAIGKSIEQIAAECVKSPNLSLATAAEKVLE